MIGSSMNEDVKKLWLDALNGAAENSYQQGRDALVRSTPEGDQWCCLGVLCDLYTKHSDKTDLKRVGNEFHSLDVTGKAIDQHRAMPPHAVLEWAGLTRSPGAYHDVAASEVGFLAEQNDNGAPFPAIALFIEKYL